MRARRQVCVCVCVCVCVNKIPVTAKCLAVKKYKNVIYCRLLPMFTTPVRAQLN
jgi:hypothetical protein